MDIGDPSDPNVDGDFLSLWQERQARKNELEHIPNLDIFEKRTKSSTNNSSLLSNLASNAGNALLDNLRKDLFSSVDSDDLDSFIKFSKQVPPKFTFCSPELRSPENSSTLLNYALEKSKFTVAEHLLETSNLELLTEDYTVTVRGVASKKSNLHILAEKGNFALTELLLSKIKNDEIKMTFLKREVLTELEGQRPRHLPVMHLAALHGHTEQIDLFRKIGVSVNVINNKKDTPVLWAARGNHIETVRYLIKHGADLHMENDKGSTPLYWAVRYGFEPLVGVLAKEGKANVNQKRKLGFFYPIILASALGYAKIVKILLDNGADSCASMSNNITSLHVAAAEGQHEVIKVLLDRDNVSVDQIDVNGNTALLYAAKGAKVRAMETLVERGADIDWKNKPGQSVWDFTINNSNEMFLKAVLVMYKKIKSRDNPDSLDNNVFYPLTFPKGRTPLHIAASIGNVDKLRCMLKLGADPKSSDLNGNTFFHVAARDDKTAVLQNFISDVSADEVNDDGDTALHVAARHNHLNAVNILLSKFKLDVKNKQGMTPLHEAIFSDAAKPEVIRKLVEYIIKASTWSLVDAVDKAGNSALHLAAKKGRPDIIVELSCLNPKIANKEGDTPFHIAARSGISSNFDTFLTTFNKPEKGVDLNQTNTTKESCLHICARRSDVNSVATLIDCGADLALQNDQGNTIIHVLIEESNSDVSRTQSLLQTFRCIVNGSAKWWCLSRSRHLPSDGSEQYFEETRRAMIFLTSSVFNGDDLNVVEFAIKLGATSFIEEILNTPNVYKIQEDGIMWYDVTNLFPDSGQKSWRKSNSVKDIESLSKAKERKNLSYLRSIVSLENDITASKILDITPINEIVSNYWENYQWIYVVFLCIHVTYMILFTVFVMPSYGNYPGNFTVPVSTQGQVTAYDASSDPFYIAFLSQGYRAQYSTKYGLFLIWPIIVLVFELFFAFSRLFHLVRKSQTKTKTSERCNWSRFFVSLGTAIVFNLGDLVSISFGVMTIIWYILFISYVSYQNYLIIVSLVFLFGWIYMINFTKAIEGLHAFTIMLKYIIVRNITRFIGIYVIFLLGCGMAFNALFQINPTIVNYSPSLSNTLFSMINMMLGLGSIFTDSFDSDYSKYGGSTGFIKTIYILYVLVSNVILMSLLVAMMTDTYTSVQSREGSTWRVGSLRLALQLEEALPMIKKLFRALCTNRDIITYDIQFERWLIAIQHLKTSKVEVDASETEEMHKSLQRVENNIEHIQEAFYELSRRIEILASERQNAAGNQIETTMRTNLGLQKFYNVVNKARIKRNDKS